jgi:hypothetical protein
MDAGERFLVAQDVADLLREAGIQRRPGASGYPHREVRDAIDLIRDLRAEPRSELEKALDASAPDRQMTLLDELRRLGRRAAGVSINMNRSQAVEARHWLLYAEQECRALRDWVISDDMTWTGFVMTLDGVLGQLEALRGYVAGSASPPVHKNEMAGAGAPPPGTIMAELNARRNHGG